MTEPHRLAAVVRAFSLDGDFSNAERYGSGHIHDTYFVSLDHDGRVERIILQRINTTIFKKPIAVMENIQRVTDHLRLKLDREADDDRRVLRLIRTHGGVGWYVDADGNYWRAYRFIADTHTNDTVTSPHQAFEAAKAFGNFQRLLVDLPGPRLHDSIPDFHNTPKRFTDFERAVKADAVERCATAGAEIAFALARSSTARALVDGKVPERVTHNDTKLNNVLLDDMTGEGICVIDLDTVMPGLAAYDFGDMVRTMTCAAAEDEPDLSQVSMNLSLFEAVLRGYLEGASAFFTTAERNSLITGAKVIVFEQGIRFLADFLSGDVYYKISRPRQNLDRCRTQFKLLESIEQQEDSMARLLRALP
ncbi:aminoglycoside phosphotransferase family protein [Telmatobacter sp. DSM 110680]|uniref:Aminoglycoside phosphotransferase family protein n=1 Tax=Telmatobacter sp. DSM 110680 TaxID=3036704 RepID=A0AAU7DDL8_9BACT